MASIIAIIIVVIVAVAANNVAAAAVVAVITLPPDVAITDIALIKAHLPTAAGIEVAVASGAHVAQVAGIVAVRDGRPVDVVQCRILRQERGWQGECPRAFVPTSTGTGSGPAGARGRIHPDHHRLLLERL